MKTTKKLIIVSGITLLPILFLSLCRHVTYTILIPQGVCNTYNGNDFGSAAICDIVPAISYFGPIFLMFVGGVGILSLIGIIALVGYFIKVFQHNKKNLESKWSYSRFMIILLILFIVLELLLPIVGMQQRKSAIEEANLEFAVPSAVNFVCGENSIIRIEQDNTVYSIERNAMGIEGMLSKGKVAKIDQLNRSFVYINDYYTEESRSEHTKKLQTCTNSDSKTFYDVYVETPE